MTLTTTQGRGPAPQPRADTVREGFAKGPDRGSALRPGAPRAGGTDRRAAVRRTGDARGAEGESRRAAVPLRGAR